MASTYVLISSNVLGSNTANVTFSSIPQTYTDLVLQISGKNPDNVYGRELRYTFNSNTSSIYSYTQVSATGTAQASTRGSSLAYGVLGSICGSPTGAMINTFGSLEMYIPNYAVTSNKQISSFAVTEIDATTNNQIKAEADYFANSTAISSIELFLNSGNFLAGSSFYLYGIKNS